MKEITDISERILQVIDYLSISRNDFAKKLGYSRSQVIYDIVNRKAKPSFEFFEKLLDSEFSEIINTEWLLSGKGEMLKSPGVMFSDTPGEGVPYYNLPVSAGHSTHEIIGSTKPDGYITNLPGADLAQAILPVTGMSMQPEIMPGALIGVRLVNNWESLNTERIYMIITRDDRMIKRIEHDNEDPQVLWCVSPNYQKFKIYKSEIIEIHRVCFVYNAK